MRDCACPEAVVIGVDENDNYVGPTMPLSGAARHDCAYIAARNALIPKAETMATVLFEPTTDHWDRAFHQSMANLVQDAYLRGAL